MGTPICPYCNRPAELVKGKKIYPHRPDLFELNFWRCEPCSAHVGCHRNGDGKQPLGRLANAELRMWKSNAHAVFDVLWKEGGMSRSQAYAKLAGALGIDKSQCHIGMFHVEQCKRVVRICAEWREQEKA